MTSVLFSLIIHRVTVSAFDFVTHYMPALYSRAVAILARATPLQIYNRHRDMRAFSPIVRRKSLRSAFLLISKVLAVIHDANGIESVEGRMKLWASSTQIEKL